MPSLFKGYCYIDTAASAKAELSEPTQFDGAIIAPLRYTLQANLQRATLTYNYKPYSTSSTTEYSLTREYPTCTDLGYLTNYSGMSLDDVVVTSWLVFAVWAVVWGIKTLTRGLKNDT